MNIWKASNFYPKHLKSIWFCPKIIRNLSKFYPTCLESVFFWLKNFKNFRICTRKHWKEYVLDPKHSKSIEFLFKIFEKDGNCNQNIQHKKHWYTMHSKIMWFWHQNIKKIWFLPKIFEKVRTSTPIFPKVSDSAQNIWEVLTTLY